MDPTDFHVHAVGGCSAIHSPTRTCTHTLVLKFSSMRGCREFAQTDGSPVNTYTLPTSDANVGRWSRTYVNSHALSHCGGLVVALTVLHAAALGNRGRGRERKRLPTENLIVPAALSLTSATFFDSYLSPSIFYSFPFPLGTSVFLFASSSVSLLLHLVLLWIYHWAFPFGSSSSFSSPSACLSPLGLTSLPAIVSFARPRLWNSILLCLAHLYSPLSVPHLAPSLRSLSWQGVMEGIAWRWGEGLEKKKAWVCQAELFAVETRVVKTFANTRPPALD